MEEKKEILTEEIKMDNDPKGEGKEKASSPLREVLSWVITLLAAFALAMVLKNYVIINATVPTGSMEHTIEPGDDLFGLRLAYQFSEPKRGDIVIFRFPDDETQKYVKRVIGLPGDEIDLRDNGDEEDTIYSLYINGELVKEDYIKAPMDTKGNIEYPYTVPENSYFVMGDNRNASSDSRRKSVGAIPKENLMGKVVFRLYPFSSIGFIK